MGLNCFWKKYTLDFKFEAGTSRGVLTTHKVRYLIISSEKDFSTFGIGECAPLKGLSIDDRLDLDEKLDEICRLISKKNSVDNCEEIYQYLQEWPSIRFALETALLDLQHGGKRKLFESDFTSGSKGIPINGLIWMGDFNFMEKQLWEKLEQGFNCIKIKVGAIDFNKECSLLEKIRTKFSPEQIEIRLDANGAFTDKDAENKLKELSAFTIHSIEQPIKAGQIELMKHLCTLNIIPVALDEELIGVHAEDTKNELLQKIKPQYIILKPTLLGGFQQCREWIKAADEAKTGWWLTSALESNVGLNAVAQFAFTLNSPMPQGLGTGKLYHNNIDSPLVIQSGSLYYDPSQNWNFNPLF
ncbi:MAG: o-succinylbenzoate synthase [Sporocytophaga sp.]|uniref:o-succinylbenzoate synthase n=1 Tax=Sporocytophaga sp. TaxID=2231183 RepID=UPI001B18D4AF|nr:enolase C-terminal domain-like protein [Sporocytophaga sp.]MBO9700646.1 o-succinylbenzoate synthase [Sporocytophaga sp.]